MAGDSAFITYCDSGSATGPVLAVKDLIDLIGVPTTAGSRVVAEVAKPAEADAPCLAGARAAGAQIIGKTNLVELALGVSGINPWFGTPVNPRDPSRIPGGSSSGSAVAVGSGEATVAYGSDTGGSIRLPAACCGVVGLKTSFGRVSLEAVWPLAPSLDTVGPMARDMAGIELGMQLLEPGFQVATDLPDRVGRVRLPSATFVDEAIDNALRVSGMEIVDVPIPRWAEVWAAALNVIEHEASVSNAKLLPRLDEIDPAVAVRLKRGSELSAETMRATRQLATEWRAELSALLSEYQFLILPTLPDLPPLVSEAATFRVSNLSPINLAGMPALALPVGDAVPIPASMQIVGPMQGEERLIALGAAIESANRTWLSSIH